MSNVKNQINREEVLASLNYVDGRYVEYTPWEENVGFKEFKDTGGQGYVKIPGKRLCESEIKPMGQLVYCYIAWNNIEGERRRKLTGLSEDSGINKDTINKWTHMLEGKGIISIDKRTRILGGKLKAGRKNRYPHKHNVYIIPKLIDNYEVVPNFFLFENKLPTDLKAFILACMPHFFEGNIIKYTQKELAIEINLSEKTVGKRLRQLRELG
ncbi:MAG: hypothetical protein ACOCXH_15990, partial [Cyclobacteriaceae bacterium]